MISKAPTLTTPLQWTETALAQYQYVKNQMRSPSTLAIFDFVATAILYTDACDEGLGCMIVQIQDDGVETVVAFGSCSLSKAQKRYHISRKEALAFIWSLGHFHLYLSVKLFLWRTDHRALKFIFDASKTGVAALQRYKLIADGYQFTTEWIPGARMVADVMSRLCVVPSDRTSSMTTFEMISVDLSNLLPPLETDEATTDIAFFNAMDEEEILIDEDVSHDEDVDEEIDFNPAKQQLHPQEDELRGRYAIDIPTYTVFERRLLAATSHVRAYLHEPETASAKIPEELIPVVKAMAKTCRLLDDRVIKVKTRGGLKEVPESWTERKQVLEQAHEGTGHKGLDGTMKTVATRYWIPAIEKVVLRHILKCETCQRFAKANKFDSPNYTIQLYDIFKHWSIDFMGPFPPDPEGNCYAIIAVETLSRWAEGIPTKTATASDAAHFLYNHIVARYGIPETILSDNGAHFANEVIENLVKILTIRHRFSTPYYPQSNGRAERFIGTLKPMMVKSIQQIDREADGSVNWTPVFYSAMYIYRATKHSVTGVSPAFLVYGEELKLPLQFDDKTPPANQIQHRDQIAHRLRALRGYIPGLRASLFRYARDTEGRKILIRPQAYKLEEKVLFRAVKYDKAGHSASPFEYRYNGPYSIYKILDKGAYVLKTLPDEKGKIKYFRKPVNWRYLRRWIANDTGMEEE
jgi:hypothetical protein